MHKNIAIFEIEGGNDKTINGHRKDTMPIISALKDRGWSAEVIFYRDEWYDQIKDYLRDGFDGYVSRVNPGSIKSGDQKYMKLLSELSEGGLLGMPTPELMTNYGAKDALVKLRHTEIVPDDTFAYYTMEDFEEKFPKTLKSGIRVLKQNRGSTGSGIWKVENIDSRNFSNSNELPLDTKIKVTEAINNESSETVLGDFMKYCEKYIKGKNGMIVDTKFMPRITEGEIRILYVGEEPIFVVHKKPAMKQGAFSATLFSGAKYTYYKPDSFKDLIQKFEDILPEIKATLGNSQTPLIWTADFMLDTDDAGNDKYILGEINCSCVGFTSHLEEGIQEKVANEIIRMVKKSNR